MSRSKLTSLDFYFDWILGAQFAGLCWAQHQGLYEQAGLQVNLIPWFHDGRSVIDKVTKAAAAGSLCAGSCEDNLIIGHIAANPQPTIRAIGAMFQEAPMVLMSRPEFLISSLADLHGKRIGMHPDGIQILTTILTLEDIDVSELDIHEVGFDLDHLLLNRFDAVQGYVMTEPVQLAQLGIDVNVFPIRHHRLQPFAQVYFATEEQTQTHADALRRFLAASHEGWRVVVEHPQDAAAVVANMLGDPSLRGEQLCMIERLIPLVAGAEKAGIGSIPADQWTRNLVTYFQQGTIPRALMLTDVIALH
jgi:NitT/TauT family transport system substrate-binding protein